MNLIKKLIQLERDASEFGFQWENSEQIMQQIQSEFLEVNEHLQSKSLLTHSTLQEEIGDLLHAVFALCLFCKFDPEQTLQATLDKLDRRFSAVKIIAKEQGLINLKNSSFQELMAIWDLAKEQVG
jgi:uncharacterized protein YabN with tetrapyrrole methylase and pyrophosphatase domain